MTENISNLDENKAVSLSLTHTLSLTQRENRRTIFSYLGFSLKIFWYFNWKYFAVTVPLGSVDIGVVLQDFLLGDVGLNNHGLDAVVVLADVEQLLQLQVDLVVVQLLWLYVAAACGTGSWGRVLQSI